MKLCRYEFSLSSSNWTFDSWFAADVAFFRLLQNTPWLDKKLKERGKLKVKIWFLYNLPLPKKDKNTESLHGCSASVGINVAKGYCLNSDLAVL